MIFKKKYFILLPGIPKKGSVFMFEIDGHYITLYGNNFCCQPVLRSTHKFKPKKYVAI